MSATPWKRRAVVFLVAIALSNIACLWYGRDFIVQGHGDFASFYAAGRLIQRGHASKVYDRTAQWEVEREFSSFIRTHGHALPYIRPPFEALLFLPLAYLTYPVACAVWMVFKCLVLVLTLALLRAFVPLPSIVSLPTPLLAILCLSASPVALDLLQGQDAILLLFVFALVYVALIHKAEHMAGMFLAVGLFKFHLVVPVLLVFALRRKFRFVFGFSLVAIILFLMSTAVVGWHGIAAYPKYLWDLSRDARSGITPPEIMPNLNGLISSIADRMGGHGYVDWLAVPILLGGIVFTAHAWPGTDDVDKTLTSAGFSLAIVTMIPTSYYLTGYDMALLILPILVMGNCFPALEANSWLPKIFYLCMALLLFVPAYWLMCSSVRRAYWMPVPLVALIPTIACLLKADRVWIVDCRTPAAQ
jgi:hypothetical protein